MNIQLASWAPNMLEKLYLPQWPGSVIPYPKTCFSVGSAFIACHCGFVCFILKRIEDACWCVCSAASLEPHANNYQAIWLIYSWSSVFHTYMASVTGINVGFVVDKTSWYSPAQILNELISSCVLQVFTGTSPSPYNTCKNFKSWSSLLCYALELNILLATQFSHALCLQSTSITYLQKVKLWFSMLCSLLDFRKELK